MKPQPALLLALSGLLWLQLPARAADNLTHEAERALAKATDFILSISEQGGYLWWYSADLKERAGESKATRSQVWVQSPGTPAMGELFLRLFEATGEKKYFTAAESAALALVRGQLESGGWDYLIEFDPSARKQWRYRVDQAKGSKNLTTFDDNNTQGALLFLMNFASVAKKAGTMKLEIQEALGYGLRKMLEAQYPNGAWPQRWNGEPRDPARAPVLRASIPEEYPREYPRQNYTEFYTLNDHTQRDCIRVMLKAHAQLGDDKFLRAALKGGDFLLLAQLPEPQPAWAQQYNFQMEPAWARAFEPPAVCTGESVGAIRTLMELHLATGEQRYLEPIPRALAWFERSSLGSNVWARFYELKTNRPIYGDRDGKIHYTVEELTAERRTGYGWQGSFDIPGVTREFQELQAKGRVKITQAKQNSQPSREPHTASADNVKRVIQTLDEQGRWLNNGRIETRHFIRNATALADFIAASK